MALTRDFRDSVVERAKRDPGYAIAMLDEAATALFNDEPEVTRLILRELVNATFGFEMLSMKTGIPAKSLHRMLSVAGNPGMDNLAAIISALRTYLKVKIEVRSVGG